jgi:hypothetical protein
MQTFTEQAVKDMRSRVHSCDDPVIAWRQIRDFPIVDIVKLEETSNGYVLGVKKTFWLSVFKRLWRRKHQLRQRKRVVPEADNNIQPNECHNKRSRMY